MSDIDGKKISASQDHYCQTPGCAKWGGFGFDRLEQGEKRTNWWCWAHYPYKELGVNTREGATASH